MEAFEKNPHAYLGRHGNKVFLYRPDETTLSFFSGSNQIWCEKHPIIPGVFVGALPETAPYTIFFPDGKLREDPYIMPLTISPDEISRFQYGEMTDAVQYFGSKVMNINNTPGTRFVVFAPAAKQVSLVLKKATLMRAILPMRFLEKAGVWEIFIPGIGDKEPYCYRITDARGEAELKLDPFAYTQELRPTLWSLVFDQKPFVWEDQYWMSIRTRDLMRPITIYEVHLGSWKKHGSNFYNFREIAPQLADYCRELGYTHVEILPLTEHPLDESWGYQVTGYFAITSRYGTPDDFRYFVNHLHTKGIGVILDWVPAHFASNREGLSQFDGTPLYEVAHPIMATHPLWKTYLFDYSKLHVKNFLLSSALFLVSQYHLDGLRVDAVTSMLFLDHHRPPGEWIPNEEGGVENAPAIELLRELNQLMHARNPAAYMIAEEGSLFPKVTEAISDGGLGFDLKWSTGWMNDSLSFFITPYQERHITYPKLKHLFNFAYNENYLLHLSHDEVSKGYKSLYNKMPGTPTEKIASLRQLFTFMKTFSGKNLVFMGGEFAQIEEWDCKIEINWNLLREPFHYAFHHFIKELNRFYFLHSPLWEDDLTSSGLQMVEFDNPQKLIVAYIREGIQERILVIHNFGNLPIEKYKLTLEGEWRFLFDTNREEFGGSGKVSHLESSKEGLVVSIPPLTSVLYGSKTVSRKSR